jgi:hypothetical protein
MRVPAIPLALAAFFLGMIIIPAVGADRDTRASVPQVALQPVTASADATEAAAPNCLLPGQIRNFGSITMVAPRRAVTLPTADCTARGGEPIASTAAVD